jgi:hypothetical protein
MDNYLFLGYIFISLGYGRNSILKTKGD